MELFRLSREPYADSLSGIGASKEGGRWNSKGTEIIYTAQSRALAMAEIAVHFSFADLPDDYRMMILYVPDGSSIKALNNADLPDRWNSFPHVYGTQTFGDDFVVKNNHLLLRVPSAVVKGDFNFLINPEHPEFGSIQILEKISFTFDGRLFE